MNQRQFKLFNRIFATVVLVVASFTYLSTIEPTTSFWDCGEFIASSYKIEVGHPPGNPVFNIIARFFTLFADKEHAAMAVNIMSALCSAFTIFFLYLTIVHLGRRIYEKNLDTHLSTGNAIALFGAGLVGALAYCWSDTFWFSAVEAEVYAMSSLFTAVVFWIMLKWEEEADEEYSNRWIILIAFLMGLSIGVHLLNLLTIPALAFIYYYKKSKNPTFWKSFGVLMLSGVILAVVLYGIIPLLPKFAAWFDLLFVNVFGLPFNSGALVFMILLLASCFLAVFLTYKKGKAIANAISLSFTMIVIGYSLFSIVIIRSSANTPTNEYQPDNPYTLVRYLGREQYGKNPLVYGQTFASVPKDFKIPKYWTPLGDKYYKADGPLDVSYPAEAKMFFPRMWSNSSDHISFYETYTGKGKMLPGGDRKMPTFKENLNYFFDFQVNWMYLRYFMWNFAGRQNDIHSPYQDPVKGNWECGIKIFDNPRLGDQSVGPDYLVNNVAKNHFYMLPLLLGLIGLFFQLSKDKQNWWVTALLFLLTGLAIVVYLNQPPYQVRERDYAYAGSFYVFSIWIGLAVLAIYNFLTRLFKKVKISNTYLAVFSTIVTLLVPIQMVSQTWDDHDRSGRYTARDMAYNYLASCDKNAILVTHGDNDTFPLWYIQEVEEVRTDIRIMNTSLLGTDWYIDQMKYKVYDSEPIPLSIEREQYLYGTNEFIPIVERVNRPITVKEAIDLFKDPRVKVKRYGENLDYIVSKKLRLPVNKENVLKYGIVAPEDADLIVDTMYIDFSDGKTNLSKPELMMLDFFANYNWDRPIYFVSMGGDLEIGLRNYLEFNGYAYKFVPIKSKTKVGEVGYINADYMYNKVMNEYRWESLADTTITIDYQNLYTFNGVMNIRNIFYQTALGLYEKGEKAKAVEVLDKMQEVMVPKNFPLNSNILYSVNEYMVLESVRLYLLAGEKEKGLLLADKFQQETLLAIQLFATPFAKSYLSKSDVETNISLYYHTIDILEKNGAPEEAKGYEEILKKVFGE